MLIFFDIFIDFPDKRFMDLFEQHPSLQLLYFPYFLLNLPLLVKHRFEVVLDQLKLMNHQLCLVLLG